MVRNLPPTTRAHADTILSSDAWVWLFEFFTPETPPRAFRFTTYSKQVEYGTFSSDGTPKVFYPGPVVPGAIAQSGDGDLPTITVTIGNVEDENGKRVGQYVDEFDGLRDQLVTIRVLSALDLEAAEPAIYERGEVQGCTITDKVVTFKISAQNLFRAQFPPYLFTKRRCRWDYGGTECGYNTAPAGTLQTCTFSLEDCEAHGDDEVARGLTRAHPLRFGNCPGIPRLGRR